MCEDLETYNSDAEHDMWVDYDYHENTDEFIKIHLQLKCTIGKKKIIQIAEVLFDISY